MFLSRLLIKSEKRYKPTELEVGCLVWLCRKLRTMIQSLIYLIVILMDHVATKGIVNYINISTSDLVKANHRLMAVSIYLS